MNIIQQQELARNSSEQQLISLAEQPNPTIMPPYLVTGELMRRKSIREKMAQAPKQTVSEEVLEEAVQSNMPQGIGALTEDMATPMAAPQEEMMSESETISETGIANLPAPNIGQNYAGGGIVGYAPGGQINVPPLVYDPYLGRTVYPEGTGPTPQYNPPSTKVRPVQLPAATNRLPAITPPLSGPTEKLIDAEIINDSGNKGVKGLKGPKDGIIKSIGKKALPFIKRHPYALGAAGLAGIYSMFSGDDEPPVAPVAPLPASVFEEKETVDLTPGIDYESIKISDASAFGDKAAASHRARMGTDPFAARQQEKLAALEADIGGSDDALNMALIRGGLGMAGGESQNFLSNLTTGVGAGVDAFVAEDDKQAKQQADLFALQTEIARAARAEEVAIATTGTNSEATAMAHNRKVDLQSKAAILQQQALDVQAASAANNPQKMAFNIMKQVDELLLKEFDPDNPMNNTPEMVAKKTARRQQLMNEYSMQTGTNLFQAAAGGYSQTQGYQPTSEEITLLQQFSS